MPFIFCCARQGMGVYRKYGFHGMIFGLRLEILLKQAGFCKLFS